MNETLNPTLMPPQAPVPSEGDALWSYTTSGEDLAELRRAAERQAGRTERYSIGRDSPLAEGVYEGAYGGEAIVVNYDADPEPIDTAVAKILNHSKDPVTGKIDKSLILDSVFDVVSSTMKYDSAAVDGIFQDVLGGEDGRKISLGYYIESGVGECRHQALFAATVLEKLSKQGVVGGKVSVDRNMVKSGPDGKYDGHAWTRYTNSAGEVFILDIAQQKLGSLTELMAAHAKDPSNVWDYARPEDKQKAVGHVVTEALGVRNPIDVSSYTNEARIIDRMPDFGSSANETNGQATSHEAAQQKTPKESMDELTANLKQDETDMLWRIARAAMNQRQAQMDGNGKLARAYGQDAGQDYRKLSKAAQDVWSRYEALFNRM